MLRCVITMFAIVILAIVAQPVAAQKTENQDAKNKDAKEPAEVKVEMVKARLIVKSRDGALISGATVRPFAFRPAAERGSHYIWDERTHGPVPTAETSDDGAVEIKVPKYVSEKLAVGEVTWQIDHVDFVAATVDLPVLERGEVVLEYGYRIAARAVIQKTDESIRDNLFGSLSGGMPGIHSEWTLKKNGILVSRVLGLARTRLRLVYLPKEGPTQFSDLISIEKPEADSVFLKKVELRPGARIDGKLDARVTRPIKNGKVIANVANGRIMPGNFRQQREQTWSWQEVTEIQEDGSFEFLSLPRGEVVQLLAVCDGWVVDRAKDDDLKNMVQDATRLPATMVVGQFISLTEDDDVVNLTLPMTAAAKCEITVVDPDDKPVVGAIVSMWPNQYLYMSGSNILGQGYSSREMLRMIQAGKRLDMNFFWKQRSRFDVTTNEKGVAVFDTVPKLGHIGAHAVHSDFEMPANGNRRYVSLNIDNDVVTETFKLQPKGTDVLGR